MPRFACLRSSFLQASRLLPAAALALAATVAAAQTPSAVNVLRPGVSNPPEAPQETPVVTISPHHGNDRYWLSGQANIIFQGDLPFHSPYEGTNSFRNAAEYKTSLLGTLYTALRPTRSIRYNTDLILDCLLYTSQG